MLELFRATPRQYRAITKTQMRSIIQNGDVAFAQQAGNRAQRAAKSAVEKHRVLAVEKLRDAAFEFAVEIGHARKHRRPARAHPMSAQRLVRGGEDVGVIRQAEVIVRTEIDYRLRFPGVVDCGAGIGTGKQLWLV